MNTKYVFALLSAVALVALAGCSCKKHEMRADHEAMEHHGHGGCSMCPMKVPGTTVVATDTVDGVMLAYTTSDASQVAELRKRVAAIPAHHEAMAEHPCACPRCPMNGPEVTAKVLEIDGGAQLVLTPKNPADLDALRAHAQKAAEGMKGGGCGSMHGGCPMMKEGEPGCGCGHMHEGGCPMMKEGEQGCGCGHMHEGAPMMKEGEKAPGAPKCECEGNSMKREADKATGGSCPNHPTPAPAPAPAPAKP